MRKPVLLSLLSLLLIASCAQNDPVPSSSPLDTNVASASGRDEISYLFPSVFGRERMPFESTFLEDEFHKDPKVISESMLYFCLGAAPSDNKEYMEGYLEQAHFENIDYKRSHALGETGYYTASRKMNGFHLILVIPDGFDYDVQWEDNFAIGAEGNGNGWQNEADYLYSEIADYMTAYNGKKVKMLLAGYSKGAAVTGLFARKLSQQKPYGLTDDDIYTYVFGAPNSTLDEGDYPFIHDFTNVEDPIVNVIPEVYRLHRAGTQVNYGGNEAFESSMARIYPEEEIDHFDGGGKYETFLDYLAELKGLLTYDYPAEAGFSAKDRAGYANNLQPGLCHLARLLFSNGLDYAEEALQGLEISQMDLVLGLASEAGFRSLIIKILEKGAFEYAEEDLDIIVGSLYPLAHAISIYRMSTLMEIRKTLQNNLLYGVLQHVPEVAYAIMKCTLVF